MPSVFDASAFRDEEKKDGSGKRDINFNEPGQAGVHGHVTESDTGEGDERQYHYVRDNEGDVYVDDNPKSGTSTGHTTVPPAASSSDAAERRAAQGYRSSGGRSRGRRGGGFSQFG